MPSDSATDHLAPDPDPRTSERPRTRRRAVRGAGLVGLATPAGCAGGGDETASTSTTPATTVSVSSPLPTEPTLRSSGPRPTTVDVDAYRSSVIDEQGYVVDYPGSWTVDDDPPDVSFHSLAEDRELGVVVDASDEYRDIVWDAQSGASYSESFRQEIENREPFELLAVDEYALASGQTAVRLDVLIRNDGPDSHSLTLFLVEGARTVTVRAIGAAEAFDTRHRPVFARMFVSFRLGPTDGGGEE